MTVLTWLALGGALIIGPVLGLVAVVVWWWRR